MQKSSDGSIHRVALQMVVIYKLSCTLEEVIDDDHDDHESVEDLKHNEDEQTDDKITDYCFCLELVMINSSSDYWCRSDAVSSLIFSRY